MIKTKQTSKGKIKIIMSGKQAKSLHKLLDKMPALEIEKYTDGKEFSYICDIYNALEEVYNPQCE